MEPCKRWVREVTPLPHVLTLGRVFQPWWPEWLQGEQHLEPSGVEGVDH